MRALASDTADRCFARIHVRTLTAVEAQALAEEIAAGDAERAAPTSEGPWF
jgi:hypothetical protein